MGLLFLVFSPLSLFLLLHFRSRVQCSGAVADTETAGILFPIFPISCTIRCTGAIPTCYAHFLSVYGHRYFVCLPARDDGLFSSVYEAFFRLLAVTSHALLFSFPRYSVSGAAGGGFLAFSVSVSSSLWERLLQDQPNYLTIAISIKEDQGHSFRLRAVLRLGTFLNHSKDTKLLCFCHL